MQEHEPAVQFAEVHEAGRIAQALGLGGRGSRGWPGVGSTHAPAIPLPRDAHMSASLRADIADLSTLVRLGDLPPLHQVFQMGEGFA